MAAVVKQEEENSRTDVQEEETPKSGSERKIKRRRNRKLLEEEAAAAQNRGICYLSRIPPGMDPLKLRQELSNHGEIQRIYLTPQDPAAQVYGRRTGGFRGLQFSEGWVEFTKKGVAKSAANDLNGTNIGRRKRSEFYDDLWNIKYLSKFKWDDLTGDIAYKNAVREQRLALENSASRRQRDFYLSKVDKSIALTNIEERRMKKKRKVQQESETTEVVVPKPTPQEKQTTLKVGIRQFAQTKPVDAAQEKARLSRDVLSRVFGGANSKYDSANLDKTQSCINYTGRHTSVF